MPLAARLIALAAAFLLAAAAPPPLEIALTYDDLPAADAGNDLAWAQASTSRLLEGLKRHRLPAAGFVNERGLGSGPDKARIALLEQWLDGGFELANHGYSHLSLTETPLDVYQADTARGATVTRALMSARRQKLRYFRHPFLRTGATADVRSGMDAWLAANDYIVAPVTVENSDWLFATVYADALRNGKETDARQVAKAYLDYTDARISWYLAKSEEVFGRQPRHIMLLHGNRLNADTVDELAALLRRRGFTAISLERAMEDPIYAMTDPYVGPDGIGWIERIGRATGKAMSAEGSPTVPADIQAAYDEGPPANLWPE